MFAGRLHMVPCVGFSSRILSADQISVVAAGFCRHFLSTDRNFCRDFFPLSISRHFYRFQLQFLSTERISSSILQAAIHHSEVVLEAWEYIDVEMHHGTVFWDGIFFNIH